MTTKPLKVGIICFWDRHATPYLEKYERVLEEMDIEYVVLFWQRTIVDRKVVKVNEKTIDIYSPNKSGLIGKITSFLRWRKIMISCLNLESYDRIIVLSTYPAVLLSNYLRKKFTNKYIFDIRDYSMESFYFFKKLVMKIIRDSSFTTISSEGYLKWLDPSEKIILNHNLTFSSNHIVKQTFFEKKVLNFAFVGNVRLDNQTRALLLSLKNSLRYRMSFIGRILPSSDIKVFCDREKVRNISFGNAFTTDEKPSIYSEIDLINAVYANKAKNIGFGDSTPIPNRLYDALIFKCPIVASEGTYLAELIDEYKIGFSLNGFDPNAECYFDHYIQNFNPQVFLSGCEKLLSKVMHEEGIFQDKLKSTLMHWKGDFV